ncbi:monocarboxylate transporter 3 isoform X1 [Dermacentor silvarum]|uniref:monocarboxylate transporter 3 isoform X1 n=1 Tax=Dermacentor silvarum TaxID=543639 RepID=UPI002101C3F9|nr:monocarboxylate transporter 3 isoform X1 [Dermacentor silvarum]
MVSARHLKDDLLFGVDSRWSWITALFCAWVLFFSMATIRIGGILFYGIVETFGVTRAEASWPVSLAGTIMVMGGAALCGLFVACNVLVAQHFEKRRATASGLVFAVFGLNSVVISPLLEFFRTTYGVRGAFLLYGAILLNVIPAVIILRSPPWLTKQKVRRRVGKCEEEDDENAAPVLVESANPDADVNKGTEKETNCQYLNKPANCDQSGQHTAKQQENISHTGLLPCKCCVRRMTAKKALLHFSLPTTASQLMTLSFLIHALSYAAVLLTVGVFVLIPADLASDRGLNPSNAGIFAPSFLRSRHRLQIGSGHRH